MTMWPLFNIKEPIILVKKGDVDVEVLVKTIWKIISVPKHLREHIFVILNAKNLKLEINEF